MSDENIQTGVLVSRLNYPVAVPYGDSLVSVSPRATDVRIDDSSKLGELPTGISFIPDQQ